ncbi:MAG: TolC family protein [bacterium]|nr:TolC family protein [bacterium]
MKFRLLIAGLLLAGSALAESEFPLIRSSVPLSLDSLIALGFQYNPSLRQAADNTRLNGIGTLNAVGNFLPTVSVGMSFSQSHYRNPTYSNPDGSVSSYPREFTDYAIVWSDTAEDGTLSNPRLMESSYVLDVPEGDSRSSQMYLSLSESVFEGGRRYFLYRMAKSQERINNLTVEDAKRSLALQIAQHVVLVQTQQKLLDLNIKLRDQRQDAYDLAQARFAVGSVTELDVLQAQIQLGSAENDITSARRGLQAQKEALNQLLGIDIPSEFPLEEAADVSPFVFDVDALVAEAYRHRTDLKIAGLTSQRARHNLRIYQSEYLPTVSLSAQWSRSEQSGKKENWTLDPRNENTSYGLSVHWNLFDGFTREYNTASRRVERDKALEAERALRLQLEREVRDSYYNLEKVYNQLGVTSRNRELAQRQLDLERERYRLGATSQLGLRDAQVTYAQAETEHLQKTLEYESSLIALDLAVGKALR